MPSGWAASDLLLLYIMTEHRSVTTPTGWTAVTGSPVLGPDNSGGTEPWFDPGGDHAIRLYAYYRFAQSGDTAPSITFAAGNAYTWMEAYRGVRSTGNPWDVASKTTDDTGSWQSPATVPGTTTTIADTRVVTVCSTSSNARKTESNSDLGSLTEHHDNGSGGGTGGFSGVSASGTKATAGAYGDTTFTFTTNGGEESVGLTLALAPDVTKARISQLPVEAVVASDSAKARTSQEPVEAVVLPTSASARTSQEPVEAVVLPTSAKARISQVAVEVLVSLGQQVAPGLITQTAVAFSPTVDQGQQVVVGLIDRTAATFTPTVRYAQFVSFGVISQAATAFAPNLINREINLARINQTAVAFAPVISFNLVIFDSAIVQTAVAFRPTVIAAADATVSLPLINRTAGAFSPRVDQPGVPSTSLVELLYDGVDIIDDVVIADATFSTQVNGIPGQCRVRVKDTPNTAAFQAGKELLLRVDGDNVWRGFVAMIHRTFAFDAEDRSTPKARFFILDGFDINILFRKRFVFNQASPIDLIGPRYASDNTFDTVAFADLFAAFLDLSGDGLNTTALIEHVGYVNIDQPASPIQPSGTWENSMRGITSLINSLYYIDPDKNVVHTDVDTPNAPLDLSDQPGVGAVGYREMELVNDGTGLINDALIWGMALGGNRVVISREQDAASIAAHGRWQLGELQGGMYKQATVDRRASSIVDGSPLSKRGAKNDRISVACTVFTDGFRVAQKVDFSSNVFDFNDVIPIRRMDVTFVNPTQLRYRLFLSHEIDMPWGFFDNYFYNYQLPGIPQIDIPIPDFPGETPCSTDELGPFYGEPSTNVVGMCDGAAGSDLEVGPVDPNDYEHQYDTYSTTLVKLYANTTYTVDYTANHQHFVGGGQVGPSNLWLHLAGSGFGFILATVNLGTTTPTASVTFNTGSLAGLESFCFYLHIYDSGYFNQNIWGSTATAHLTYVSGPDPRYEGREFVIGVGGRECVDGFTDTVIIGDARWDIVTDGVATTFFLPTAYQPGSTQLFIDGLFQRPSYEYIESNPATGEILILNAPANGAVISIFYIAAGDL